MGLKYQVGKNINNILIYLLQINYKLLSFIPNGRFVELDILRSREKIDVIFDVGANVGQTAIQFSKIFPNSAIHSFEPVANTFKQLNFCLKKYCNIIPFKIALGNQNTFLTIKLNEDSELNSLKGQISSASQDTETVEVITGLNHCNKNKIEFIGLLKIDTEGFEMDVLEGFGYDFLKKNIKFIYCEVGFDRNSDTKTHFSDIEAYLKNLGYVTSGFYEQNRWGKSKLMLGFSNVLFANTNYVQIF